MNIKFYNIFLKSANIDRQGDGKELVHNIMINIMVFLTLPTVTTINVTYKILLLLSNILELLGSAKKIILCVIHVKYEICHRTCDT